MAGSSSVHAANAWLIVVVVLLAIAFIVLLVLYFTKTCPPCPATRCPTPLPIVPPTPLTLVPAPVGQAFGQLPPTNPIYPPTDPTRSSSSPLYPVAPVQNGTPFTYGTRRLYAQRLLEGKDASFLSRLSGASGVSHVSSIPVLYSLTTFPTSHPLTLVSQRDDALVLRVPGDGTMYYVYADPSSGPVGPSGAHGFEETSGVVIAPAVAMLRPLSVRLNRNGTVSDASMSRYVVHSGGHEEFSVADVGAVPLDAAVFQNPSSTSTVVQRSRPLYRVDPMTRPFALYYGSDPVHPTDVPSDHVVPGNTPCFQSFLDYMLRDHPALYRRFEQQSGFLGGNSSGQAGRVLRTDAGGAVYASDVDDCFDSGHSYLSEIPIACGSSVNEQVVFSDVAGRGLALRLFADGRGNHYVGDRTATRFLYANPMRDVYAGTQFLLQPPGSSVEPAVFRVVPLMTEHEGTSVLRSGTSATRRPEEPLVRNVGRKAKTRHVRKKHHR